MERCELLHTADQWQKGSKYTYFTNLQLEKEASCKTAFSFLTLKKVTFFYNDLGVQD